MATRLGYLLFINTLETLGRPNRFVLDWLYLCVGVKGLVRGLRHNRLSYCLIVQR